MDETLSSKQAPNPAECDLSVIIPNLNSPIIDRVVQSVLEQQTALVFEIIVVGMDQPQLIPTDPRVQIIDTAVPTPAARARNLGAEIAHGKVFAFLDADCIAQPGWLEGHWQAHQAGQKQQVGGSVLFPQGGYVQLCDNVATFHEYMPYMRAGKRRVIPSLNMSVPRSLWEALGGFDTAFPKSAGEDADFSRRVALLSAPVCFRPSIQVLHQHNRTTFKPFILHAWQFGKYSPRLQIARKRAGRSRWLMDVGLIMFSPLIALGITGKVLLWEWLRPRYWHTLPLFWLSKVVWCAGATAGNPD